MDRLLLALLCLSQVCANPMFFWSQQQPDCSEQSNDNTYQTNEQNTYQGYQAPSYQGSNYQDPSYQGTAYQGPSYQETLQNMITETLRALCDIVQSTMRASKQEIATLARLILQKGSTSDCATPEEESYYEPTKPTIGSSSPAAVDTQGSTTLGLGSSTTTKSVVDNSIMSTTTSDFHNSTVSSSLKGGLNSTLTSNSTLSELKPANSTHSEFNTTISSSTMAEKMDSNVTKGTD